ncbi:MAG: oligopeptide/dipeptide ABC transporter ATP-binding protein [Candidatus Eisenbacteria bacterium]|nr:oligopeptide/dipeptide ABC transporter ATP-binding protein [Candidatus Eisenbacteria bacterium]
MSTRPKVTAEPILSLRDLAMHFPAGGGGLFGGPRRLIRALDGVDLDIARGETLGLVGESGSGKSTLGRCLVRLYQPTRGKILFEGEDLAAMNGEKLRKRRQRLQMIFQDPYASLNPRMTVEDIVAEPIRVHRLARGADIRERVKELMEMVGLDPRFIRRYPHEFSGGQRQRVGIARALATQPTFIVADEPISALDVSIQAQILNLLADLKERLHLTTLFISHDLSAIRHVSDRVAVLYLGRLAEIGPAALIDSDPRHPYTVALLSAAPRPDPRAAHRPILLAGDPPSPLTPPSGCRFHPRCPLAVERCRVEEPLLRELEGDDKRLVACHLAEEVSHLMGMVGRVEVSGQHLSRLTLPSNASDVH